MEWLGEWNGRRNNFVHGRPVLLAYLYKSEWLINDTHIYSVKPINLISPQILK